jgi:hypothetical protein
MGERRTEDGRWSTWDEAEARRSLGELAGSGESVAQFARRRGISAQRVYYWKKRLAETRAPTFVAVPLGGAGDSQIEIVANGVTIRVREGIDVERLAEIVEVVARRSRGC